MTEKTFAASSDSLPLAIAFAEEELENADFPMKAIMQITISLEEMFINIARYAYDGNDGYATISIDCDSEKATIVLTDNGKPFDPLKKEDPDITLSAEERSIGGLGIFMVKKYMTGLSYLRENDKNIFSMTYQL